MASPMVVACTVRHVAMEQAGAVERTEDGEDAAGAVDVLDVVAATTAPPCRCWAPGATAGRCRPW